MIKYKEGSDGKMFEKLLLLSNRYDELQLKMSQPDVLANPKEIVKYSKEISDLEDVVNKYREYAVFEIDKAEAEQLLKTENDIEMKQLYNDTIEDASVKMTDITDQLKVLLLPKDENDDKNIIMEIRGAAGGDEANIFAGDLFRMYSKFAEVQG